jgi:hypothetical protein
MPGETVTVDTTIEGPEQRRSRRERPDREMTQPEIDPVTIEESATFSPEDAVADAARKLQESQRSVETERAGRLAAERTAADARQQVQQANAGRTQDRTAAVAAAVEAAKSEADLAEAAFVSAREMGDAGAEAKALRAMSQADFRLNQATGELATIQANGQRQQDQPRQQQNGPGPAAQAWINRNPRFNTDTAFKQAALTAHAEAITDGIVAESPAYFRHIESRLLEAGHEVSGAQPQERQQRMEEPRTPPRRQEQFSGAPPSRGDGGGASRANTVQTLLGPVTVNRRADGKVGIQIPQNLRENFEEGAKITGMTLAEYAYEQVQVAEERKAGGNGGMIESETQTWR